MSKYLDLNGLETVWGKVTDKITESKADWNQNDETADNYVKNRTHWENGELTPLVTNFELSFSAFNGGVYYESTIEEGNISEDNYYYTDSTGAKWPVKVGDTCTVVWDNITYECAVYDFSMAFGYSMFGIGDNKILTGNQNIIDIPFLIMFYPYTGDSSNTCAYISCINQPTNNLLSISRNDGIYKLPNKFIDNNFINVATELASDKILINIPIHAGAQAGGSDGSLYQTNANSYASSLGLGSSIFGYQTNASGDYAHAEGDSTTASGENSHAEGLRTTASGDYSHAEGSDTRASGSSSHAEGSSTKATKNASHAEGSGTTASGNDSHAEGDHTTASGNDSHAEGLGTIASSVCQHVQGEYNIEDSSHTYAHIVGNGSYTARSNAHTLDWSGNAWFQGSVYVGGTGQTDTAAIKILPAKLVSTETTPTTNDTIYWLYE